MEKRINKLFLKKQNSGLILAGIVGCGKTTLIEHCLKALKQKFKLFSYTGDDTKFRANISADSKYGKT